jgi:NAD(P)-dependent dehydrogenase (short-subunit alcohol dehydrogenase family)
MSTHPRGLTGRNVLITGGAKGQGLNHAKAFADAGADLALLDITEPIPDIYPLADARMLAGAVTEVEKRGRRAVGLPCDVRDELAVESAVTKALDFFDARIDILINNAGTAAMDTIHHMRPGTGSGMVSGMAETLGTTPEQAYEMLSGQLNMPGDKWRVEMSHITDAVLFLASDNADQITGHVLRVEAGQNAR